MANNRELSQFGGFVSVNDTNKTVGIATTVSITAGGLFVGGVQAIRSDGTWGGSAAGIQGAQGTSGVQGTAGTQGTTGAQGFNGTLGTQGATGTQGTQGSTGTQGTTGTTGTQGISGATVGGTANQVVYKNGSNVTSGDAGLTFNDSTNTLALGSQHQLIIGSFTKAQRDALTSVASGSILYNTTDNTGQIYNGTEWRQIQTKSTLSPGTRSSYPISPSYNAVYTTPWTGNPANLPTSDTNSTWTAPVNAVEARVIVVGAGGGWPGSYGGRGRGAYVDALLPITGGASYKVIVGEKGADTSNTGTGGHGCGGGPGVDSNDTGSGSGGSAFFFAPPAATSDPAMFPNGVLIAGAGGGGSAPTGSHAGTETNNPDPIGGFVGVSAKGVDNPGIGEPGGAGGIGGRARNSSGGSLLGSNAIRGEGGTLVTEAYGNCQAGGGGGAGGGGAGGACPGSGSGEDAPNGRGYGYGGYNTSGAGRGGDYPMRGGNGFTFQGVNLGGGGGGSHGRAAGSGGWGGGGGSLYDLAGGAGGSGAWGYIPGQVNIYPVPSSGPPGIPINGGTLGGNTPFPTTAGLENTDGAIIIMWFE